MKSKSRILTAPQRLRRAAAAALGGDFEGLEHGKVEVAAAMLLIAAWTVGTGLEPLLQATGLRQGQAQPIYQRLVEAGRFTREGLRATWNPSAWTEAMREAFYDDVALGIGLRELTKKARLR